MSWAHPGLTGSPPRQLLETSVLSCLLSSFPTPHNSILKTSPFSSVLLHYTLPPNRDYAASEAMKKRKGKKKPEKKILNLQSKE